MTILSTIYKWPPAAFLYLVISKNSFFFFFFFFFLLFSFLFPTSIRRPSPQPPFEIRVIRPCPISQLRLPFVRDPREPVALGLINKGLTLLQTGSVVALAHNYLLDMHPRKHARTREVTTRHTDLKSVVVAPRDAHVLDALVLEVLEHGSAGAESLRRIEREQVACTDHRVELINLETPLVALL